MAIWRCQSGPIALSSVLSRVFKVEYIQSRVFKVFKGIAICSCQLCCGLSRVSDIRAHQLSPARSQADTFIHESSEGEHLFHHLTVQSYKWCDVKKHWDCIYSSCWIPLPADCPAMSFVFVCWHINIRCSIDIRYQIIITVDTWNIR